MVHYQVDNIDTSPLVSVTENARVEDALEAMFSRGHSHIGVVEDGELRGIVSHQSITRTMLIFSRSQEINSVMDRSVTVAMEDPSPIVNESTDVFSLFTELATSPYVLIEYDDEYHVLDDVGFHQYLEQELQAFMLIEEIERMIRDVITDVYGTNLSEELEETFESIEVRTPSSIEDFSFTHYHIFFSVNWDQFADYFDEDSKFVCELLDGVGDIRNTLFHIRSDAQGKVTEQEYIEFVRDYLENQMS